MKPTRFASLRIGAAALSLALVLYGNQAAQGQVINLPVVNNAHGEATPSTAAVLTDSSGHEKGTIANPVIVSGTTGSGSGSATSANQTTANTSLAAIQATLAGTLTTTVTNTPTVNLGTLNGAATAANQATANTSLSAIQSTLGGTLTTSGSAQIKAGNAVIGATADRFGRVAPTLGGYSSSFTGSVTNTATLVSASPQYLTAAQFTQFNASVGCFSLYDASSTSGITLGTTAPVGSWCTTAAGNMQIPLPPAEGLNFTRGIVAACVGGYNASSTPGTTSCSYNLVSSFPQSRYQVVSNPLVFANSPMTNAWGCQGQFTATACTTATTLNPTSAAYTSLGSAIAPLNLPVLWSVGNTATPGNAGTGAGLADLVTDQGFSTASGSHSLYATIASGSLGGACGTTCWLYNASSAVNPFSIDGSGNLVITSGYDSTNSRWYTGEINSQSSYKYQTDGYTTPVSGFYYEVQFAASGTPPTGFCPWSSQWIKNSQSYDSGNSTTWSGNHNGIEVDNLEMCLSGPISSTSSYDYQHPNQTKHEFGSITTVTGQLAGTGNQRFVASPPGAFTFNPFDGANHFAGMLVTPNWYVMFVDRREIYRVAKTGMEEEQVGYVLKFTGGKGYATPTASTSSTWALTIKAMSVYACTTALGCPVN